MPICKILAIFFVSFVAMAGAAQASETGKRQLGAKAPKAAAVAVPLPPVRHVVKEAPIVMGRSVSVRRKSRLRHVKAKPVEQIERAIVPAPSSEASLAVSTQR